jgi:hypothetical protein
LSFVKTVNFIDEEQNILFGMPSDTIRISRSSETFDNTALILMNFDFVSFAITSASVVFPQPGVPQRIMLENVPDFMSFGSKHFGPSMCSWPTIFQAESSVAFLWLMEYNDGKFFLRISRQIQIHSVRAVSYFTIL